VAIETVRQMDEMTVSLELVDGADPAVAVAVGEAINSALSIRAAIQIVPRGTLPRFELKARRFHDRRERTRPGYFELNGTGTKP
jgi:phenylacetate-CoA ligase